MAKTPRSPGALVWRRRFRLAVRMMAGLIIVLLVGVLIWSYMANKDLDRAIQATAAAGGSLDIDDLARRPVPDDLNAWPIYKDLLVKACDQGVGMAGQLKLKSKTVALSVAEQDRLTGDTIDWELLARWWCEPMLRPDRKDELADRLAEHEALLTALSAGADRPELVWPVSSVDVGPAAPMGVYPQPLSRLLDFVMARAVSHFDSGRSAEAIADVTMIFRVANHITNLPLLAPYHLRATGAGTRALQEMLPDVEISAKQRAGLAKELADGVTKEKLRWIVEVDRAVKHRQYTQLLNGKLSLAYLNDESEPPWPFGQIGLWLREPAFTSNHANQLTMYTELIPLLGEPSRDTVVAVEEFVEGQHKKAREFTGFTHAWALNGAAHALVATRAALMSRTTRRLALLALALHAWRQDKGDWPETLDELTPAYIDAIPIDPTSGEPLGYLRDDAFPRIYAAGIDWADNGGAYAPGDPWGQEETDVCFFLEGIPPDARAKMPKMQE